MSRDVITVTPDAPLTKVRSLLHERGFHHVLVVDTEDALLGVISDRDVLRALGSFLESSGAGASEDEILDQPAFEVMRPDPVTLFLDTAIEKAAQLLLDNDVSALPVVHEEALIGLVTTEHLLQYYTHEV